MDLPNMFTEQEKAEAYAQAYPVSKRDKDKSVKHAHDYEAQQELDAGPIKKPKRPHPLAQPQVQQHTSPLPPPPKKVSNTGVQKKDGTQDSIGSYCRIYTTGAKAVKQFDVQVCTDDSDYNCEKTIELATRMAQALGQNLITNEDMYR